MRQFTYRIFFAILILSAGNAFAGTGSKGVAIKTLLKKMSRAELLKTLGPHALSDSTTETKNGQAFQIFLFEPVTFEGVPSLIEVILANDSTSMITVHLPYIGRPATRLKFPYATSFVHSTFEDYNQMERKIEDELGMPTVLTSANFEYMNGAMQNIFGVFENEETRITIIPS